MLKSEPCPEAPEASAFADEAVYSACEFAVTGVTAAAAGLESISDLE